MMIHTRWHFIATSCACLLAALTLGGSCSCDSRNPGSERTRVRIAVPSTPTTYLPIYLARELGYYQEQGLDVTTEDVPGGSKALQAMFGGSVDVAASFFENAIQLDSEGRRVQSFMLLQERPGFVLAVSPASPRNIRTVEDLKGAVVGVTTPGSASHHFVNYLLLRHNVPLTEVSITGIGLGPTSVAAIERGHIDAGVLIGSSVTAIEHRFPKLITLADTGTAEGVKQLLGTEVYPGPALLAPTDWLHGNPATARKLAGAVQRATQWMREHSPEEIRSRMPTQYRAPDVSADLETLRTTIPMLSRDGTISPAGAEAVRKVLAVSSETVRTASMDLAQTYTNQFVAPRQ